jgi:ADP-ribose pyrophosphatase YjhB (NUDIX family)
MITFDKGNFRFNYRAVAVVLNGKCVLLHREEHQDFWSLPGGRIELMESARDAIKREMEEELEVEAHVERLLWVVENFFEWDRIPYHEVGLYFLISLGRQCPLYGKKSFQGSEEGTPLIFQWHDVDDLEDAGLYPSFLRASLCNPPEHPEYIVHVD